MLPSTPVGETTRSIDVSGGEEKEVGRAEEHLRSGEEESISANAAALSPTSTRSSPSSEEVRGEDGSLAEAGGEAGKGIAGPEDASPTAGESHSANNPPPYFPSALPNPINPRPPPYSVSQNFPRDLSGLSAAFCPQHGPHPFGCPHIKLAGENGTRNSHIFSQSLMRCTGEAEQPFWNNSCLHAIFLVFFVVFLIVGVALTCLGFLDLGARPDSSRTFRILGVVALLLCIGFLIAACVIVSECITSALNQSDVPYSYQALYPSYTDSLHASACLSNHGFLSQNQSDYMLNPCPHQLQQAQLVLPYTNTSSEGYEGEERLGGGCENTISSQPTTNVHPCTSCPCHNQILSTSKKVPVPILMEEEATLGYPSQPSVAWTKNAPSTAYRTDSDSDEDLRVKFSRTPTDRRQWV